MVLTMCSKFVTRRLTEGMTHVNTILILLFSLVDKKYYFSSSFLWEAKLMDNNLMYRYWDLHWNEPGGKGIFDVYVLYAFTLTIFMIRNSGILFCWSSLGYWSQHLLVGFFSIGGV